MLVSRLVYMDWARFFQMYKSDLRLHVKKFPQIASKFREVDLIIILYFRAIGSDFDGYFISFQILNQLIWLKF